MKKLMLVLLVAVTVSWTMTSCGGKKEEGKEEETKEEGYNDYDSDDKKEESSEDLIKQGQLLVDQSDCKTCHHATNKIIGPAHADVAKKY